MTDYDYAITGTSDTWIHWSATGTSSTSTDRTWIVWTDFGAASDATWSDWTNGTASSMTPDIVWSGWTSGDEYIVADEVQHIPIIYGNRGVAVGEITPDEFTLQARRENEERIQKLQDSKKRAEDKAKELLLDLIGEEELKVYERTGRVMVKGRKHDYIVSRDGSFVKRIEKDKVVDLCIHLEQHCPETDNVIALKLLAEADEKVLNKIANVQGSKDRPEELPECACG